VDFGFGTFLEKVEENFGKFWLKVILVSVMIGVVTFAGHAFITKAVKPIWLMISGFFNNEKVTEITSSTLLAPAVAVIIGAVLSYVGGRLVISIFLIPRMNKLVEDHEISKKSNDELQVEVDVARLELFKDIIENGPTENLKNFVAQEEKRLNKGDN